MARIRTIKPEFWRDEDLSKVTAEAALLAIGLLNHSDDEGYFNANPKLIESDVFPLRELSSSTPVLLQELASIGYLQLFSGSDGKRYGQVVNFAKHQVINEPTPSKIKDLCTLPENYGSDTVGLHLGKEGNGTGNREQGKENTPIAAKAARVSVPDETFDRFWEAYDYKLGRHKALKAWQSIKPDAELAEKIIAAALVYNKANPSRAYYKHATTWLNGRNWEDSPNDLLPKIARMQPKTEHQMRQDAVARSIFGHLYQNPANAVIEGDVIDATENTTPRLG